ncbi:EboA domain-containing protein [Streptomyces capparidis]
MREPVESRGAAVAGGGDGVDPPEPPELPSEVSAALFAALEPAARGWLDSAVAAAGRGDAWEACFTCAGRHVGRRALPGTAWTAADAARTLILRAARADAGTVARLYRQGDAAERRAVLYALPYLPVGAAAVELVHDALRANDTRLVAAAVGPYAARHLDPHAWRHAVLKCVFTGVPVSAVAGLRERADAELGRMLTAYAAERRAAGRPVPDDVPHVLALTTPHPPTEA